MRPSQLVLRLRHRGVWSDPVRKLRTLESFAETEADGGRDLSAAARRISDPELRGHVLRHAQDEERHARLFRTRAAELRAELALGFAAEGLDRPYDLSRGRRGEVDAHGFFSAGLLDDLGEVEYVAMLHVAERRAAELFETHSALNSADPRTRAVFDEILKDEKYHVAYTKRILDHWRTAGLERAVERGLDAARSSRFLGAWKRLGARSGSGFGHALLFVLYWTLLLPFALVSLAVRDAHGWRATRVEARIGGQY